MRMSIRYQLVGLVGALLLSAMAAYVYLATSLVTEDKRATLYDVNALLAGTLAEQTDAELQGLLGKLLYFGEEQQRPAAPNAAPDRRAQSLFSSDEDILQLEVWRQGPSGFTRTYAYSNPRRLSSWNLNEEDLKAAHEQAPLDWSWLQARKVRLENISLAPDLALLRLAVAAPDRSWAVVTTLRPDRLLRIFGRSGLYTRYLVDDRGQVVVHPEAEYVLQHKDLSQSPVVADTLDAKRSRGAREFQGPQGELLGAYARVPLGELSVVVEVPKDEVLRAARDLARRSVFFAACVLFLALLLSVGFSRWVTSPLRDLRNTMVRISQGEFGVEVPVRSRNEIGELAQAFNQMSRELSERDRLLAERHRQLVQSEKLSAIGEMSAGLAHEVKNPMVGIVGFAQLGQQSTSLAETHEFFSNIESDAQRANSILQRLLEFARPQATEFVPLDLNGLVQGALKLVTHPLQLQKVRVETELAGSLPPVRGNENQLSQVLINLFMNAGHAMEESPQKRLLVRTEEANGGVRIEVSDSGHGMSEEVRSKLFQPFFTTKSRGKGTGLGLSVSASIVEQHRGRIEVESELGKGTRFRVWLPQDLSAPSAEPAPPPARLPA